VIPASHISGKVNSETTALRCAGRGYDPALPLPIHAQTEADPAAGIRQAQSGEFDGAAITLEGVVGRSGSTLSAHDRGRAYTYLSIAYHGLGQTEKAKQRLLQALQADPALTLDPKEFPPKIMDFFGQTLKEAGWPMPTPRPAQPAAAAPSRHGGKIAIIVVDWRGRGRDRRRGRRRGQRLTHHHHAGPAEHRGHVGGRRRQRPVFHPGPCASARTR
jgi:hypothetical protein